MNSRLAIASLLVFVVGGTAPTIQGNTHFVMSDLNNLD
jgi:hypothetical protein